MLHDGSVLETAGPQEASPTTATTDETHGWVIRLWLVTGAFAAVTLVRSAVVGIPLRDPGGAILLSRVALTAGLFAAMMLVEAVARTPPGSRRDRRALLATARQRWPRQRLALAWSALLAYHVVYFCYHNLKSWDVLNRPRDAALTALDRWLFLGHSPAVLLHDLLGQGVAAYALVLVYESFPTLVVVAIAATVFTPRLRDGVVVLGALIWMWILGVASYYLVPSLGPFHDRPQDFAGLPHTIVTTTQALYMAQRAHLLSDPSAPDAFAQVSAFASLHIGITAVLALAAAYLGFRRTAWALRGFLALTVVATVYLGWHFVVDDVAGLLLAWLAFQLGRATVAPGELKLRDGWRISGGAA